MSQSDSIPGLGLFKNGTAPKTIVGLPGNVGGVGGPPLTQQNVDTFGQGSSGFGITTSGSPFQNFSSWLPYFLLLGGALYLVNQGKYAGVGNALAAVVVGGYAVKNWNGIVTGFDNTFGTGIAQSASVPS